MLHQLFRLTNFKFTNFWLSFSHFVGFSFFIAKLYDANPWFSWLPLLHNQWVYPNLCQAVHCSCFTFFSIKVSSILKYYTDYREAEKKGKHQQQWLRGWKSRKDFRLNHFVYVTNNSFNYTHSLKMIASSRGSIRALNCLKKSVHEWNFFWYSGNSTEFARATLKVSLDVAFTHFPISFNWR